MALKSDGSLYTWGRNNYGQLGDGTSVDKLSPIQVGTDHIWTSVSSGYDHAIAIKSDGSLYTWGYNNVGQLGNGTSVNTSLPIRIGTAADWLYTNADFHVSIGIKSNGFLYTWGCNNSGQLGDGTIIQNNRVPTQIGTDTDWTSVDTSSKHSLGIKSDGSMYIWGNNEEGQLGDGTSWQTSPIVINYSDN